MHQNLVGPRGREAATMKVAVVNMSAPFVRGGAEATSQRVSFTNSRLEDMKSS